MVFVCMVNSYRCTSVVILFHYISLLLPHQSAAISLNFSSLQHLLLLLNTIIHSPVQPFFLTHPLTLTLPHRPLLVPLLLPLTPPSSPTPWFSFPCPRLSATPSLQASPSSGWLCVQLEYQSGEGQMPCPSIIHPYVAFLGIAFLCFRLHTHLV